VSPAPDGALWPPAQVAAWPAGQLTLQGLQDGTDTEQDDPPGCDAAGGLFDWLVAATA
jgi:hypothetical protein